MAGVGLTVLRNIVPPLGVSIPNAATTVLASISGSSFVAGHRYLLIATGTVSQDGGSSAELLFYQSPPDGSGTDLFNIAQFAGDDWRNDNAKGFMFVSVVTADGTTPWDIVGSDYGAVGSSSYLHWPRMVALDLDGVSDAFQENVDWFYSRVAGGSSSAYLLDPTVWQKGSSLLLETDASDDHLWLILGSSIAQSLKNGGSPGLCESRIVVDDSVNGNNRLISYSDHYLKDDTYPDMMFFTMPHVAILKSSNAFEGSGFTDETHAVRLETRGTFSSVSEGMWRGGNTLFAMNLKSFEEFKLVEDYNDTTTNSSVGGGGATYMFTARPDKPFHDIDPTGTKDLIDIGHIAFDPASGGNADEFAYTVTEEPHSSGTTDAIVASPFTSNRFIGDNEVAVNVVLPWLYSKSVTGFPYDPLEGKFFNTGGGAVVQRTGHNYIGFYNTISAATKTVGIASMDAAVAFTFERQADADVFVAQTLEALTDLEALIADSHTRVVSLGQVIAQTLSLSFDANTIVAGVEQVTATLQVSKEGSEQREVLLRILIASTNELAQSLEVLAASTNQIYAVCSMAVSDAPFITIEPDRPKFEPEIVIDDLETS